MNNEQLAKGEDELIRRLGMAVANKWGAIPPFAQDQLLDEACVNKEPGMRNSLKSFLQKDQKSPLE